jgi:DNA invertase Pin-like site-specific DNA recombinase
MSIRVYQNRKRYFSDKDGVDTILFLDFLRQKVYNFVFYEGRQVVIAFLRGKNQELSILKQQEFILDYAKKRGIAIDLTELDNSSLSTPLEERESFLEMLRSLKEGDTILIYDTTSLSNKVGELVKTFDCVFKHGITVHICKRELVIDKSIDASFMMSMLAKQREQNRGVLQKSIGRPKGSFSKSKFDPFKQDIVKMLEEGMSVSKIAKKLGFSRSSLKDYINSRSLKEIANLQHISDVQKVNLHINDFGQNEKCPLTDG